MVHGAILGGFLLYSIFLAGPIFDRFEAVADEAQLVSLRLPAETNDVHYGLDRFVVSSSALEIHGWAFLDGHDTRDQRTYVVLWSEQATYSFDTYMLFASYVPDDQAEPGLNLDSAGFISTIPARKITPGQYVLGLFVARDESQGFKYTDVTLVKSPTDGKLKVLKPDAPGS